MLLLASPDRGVAADLVLERRAGDPDVFRTDTELGDLREGLLEAVPTLAGGEAAARGEA